MPPMLHVSSTELPTVGLLLGSAAVAEVQSASLRHYGGRLQARQRYSVIVDVKAVRRVVAATAVVS